MNRETIDSHPSRRMARRFLPAGKQITWVLAGLIFLLAQSSVLAWQAPEPPKPVADQDAIQVGVDIRVELMNIIARLNGNPEYKMPNSKSPYSERVEKHFEAFKDHKAIDLFRKGRARYGWSYDAVPSLALHLGPLPELKERMPFDKKPARLDQRWQNESTAEFLTALREFVAESKAEAFFASEAAFYRSVEERMRKMVKESNPVPWFDGFFGTKAGADYRVIPGLLCGGGNYGVGVVLLDGAPEEIRPVLGCWQWDKEGLPIFEEKTYLGTFVHELCHSYTNPLCDRHLKELEPPIAAIFPSVAARMRRMAYGMPKTVLYETLVRACVIRYLEDHKGKAAAAQEKSRQKAAGFAWVPGLADLLADYAKDRKTYPNLDAFAPAMAKYLEESAKNVKP